MSLVICWNHQPQNCWTHNYICSPWQIKCVKICGISIGTSYVYFTWTSFPNTFPQWIQSNSEILSFVGSHVEQIQHGWFIIPKWYIGFWQWLYSTSPWTIPYRPSWSYKSNSDHIYEILQHLTTVQQSIDEGSCWILMAYLHGIFQVGVSVSSWGYP